MFVGDLSVVASSVVDAPTGGVVCRGWLPEMLVGEERYRGRPFLFKFSMKLLVCQ